MPTTVGIEKFFLWEDAAINDQNKSFIGSFMVMRAKMTLSTCFEKKSTQIYLKN